MNQKKTVLAMIPETEEGKRRFSAAGDYRVLFAEEPTDSQLAEAEIIVGEPTMEQIHKAKRLEWLQIVFAGADYYTQAEDYPHHITLTNMSGAYGQSISEYVLAMIFSLYKKMHLYRDQQRAEIWEDCGKEESLVGKTVLILGAGDIGSCVAVLTKKFDCYNIGVRRVAREVPDYLDEVHTLEELDQLLPRADIVVSSLPETPATRNVLSKERIAEMKPTAILINVGRGSAVDLDALDTALEEGKLAGAAIDVTVPEPLPKGHPLWQCKNAILTPHITGCCFGHLDETERKLIAICAENLEHYANGEPLINLVDFQTGYRITT